MGTPINDPHEVAACDFINGYYAKRGRRAPESHSREEQHAISVLAAYIRENAALEGANTLNRYPIDLQNVPQPCGRMTLEDAQRHDWPQQA